LGTFWNPVDIRCMERNKQTTQGNQMNQNLEKILKKASPSPCCISYDMPELDFTSVDSYVSDIEFYFYGYTEYGNDRNIHDAKDELRDYRAMNVRELKMYERDYKTLIEEYKETKRHLKSIKKLLTERKS